MQLQRMRGILLRERHVSFILPALYGFTCSQNPPIKVGSCQHLLAISSSLGNLRRLQAAPDFWYVCSFGLRLVFVGLCLECDV